jgi:hypothetical protein
MKKVLFFVLLVSACACVSVYAQSFERTLYVLVDEEEEDYPYKSFEFISTDRVIVTTNRGTDTFPYTVIGNQIFVMYHSLPLVFEFTRTSGSRGPFGDVIIMDGYLTYQRTTRN